MIWMGEGGKMLPYKPIHSVRNTLWGKHYKQPPTLVPHKLPTLRPRHVRTRPRTSWSAFSWYCYLPYLIRTRWTKLPSWIDSLHAWTSEIEILLGRGTFTFALGTAAVYLPLLNCYQLPPLRALILIFGINAPNCHVHQLLRELAFPPPSRQHSKVSSGCFGRLLLCMAEASKAINETQKLPGKR